jgi:hypothetical protein
MIKRSFAAVAASVGVMAAVLGLMSGSAYAATGQSGSDALGWSSLAQAVGSNKTLTFAGYQWLVKNSTTGTGPGPNLFDVDGPYVDSSGHLHLRLFKSSAGWECSEVVLDKALGYGTYRWSVEGPVSTLDPNVVFAIFTYDYANNTPANKELDFEAARFAEPGRPTNAQYVMQPYEKKGNLQRITLPNRGVTTLTLTWLPGRITFSADSLPSWTKTGSAVPTSSGAQLHMNLWLYKGVPPDNGKNVQVVVTSFHFTPA